MGQHWNLLHGNEIGDGSSNPASVTSELGRKGVKRLPRKRLPFGSIRIVREQTASATGRNSTASEKITARASRKADAFRNGFLGDE